MRFCNPSNLQPNLKKMLELFMAEMSNSVMKCQIDGRVCI